MLVSLHNEQQILSLLTQDRRRHVYAIGDLDPFFWPRTVWYGWLDGDEIGAIVLLYLAPGTPNLLAFSTQPGPLEALLLALAPLLPRRFYAHLDHGLERIFEDHAHITRRGSHLRMALTQPDLLAAHTVDAERMGPHNLAEIETLYADSYPSNWFDPAMLATGYYVACREDGVLRAIAGVHVVSNAYAVAALGNITSHPDARGRGLAKAVTATLCSALLSNGIDEIALNVHVDNHAAISLYRTLGFEAHCTFLECMISW